MQTIAAIDPGAKSGGIAIADQNGIRLFPMPADPADLRDLIPFNATVVIEKVPPFVGRLIPSSAAFKLGKSAGWLEGFTQGRQQRLILVTPQAWQAGLGIPRGDRSQSQWKAALKAEAARRYPSTEGLTLKTADALLLLDYALRQPNNFLSHNAQS
jgi:hypothetical protein